MNRTGRRMKSWTEYQQQKDNAQFGDYLEFNERQLQKKDVAEFLRALAYSIGRGAFLAGYKVQKPSAEVIMVRPGFHDPLNMRGTIGGKVRAELTATQWQYVNYVEHFLTEQIIPELEAVQTWRGYICMRWRQWRLERRRRVEF
jgi:hypothetical protein